MSSGRFTSKRRFLRVGLVSGAALSAFLPHLAGAQVAGKAEPPPVKSAVDANGVDLTRGTFAAALPELTIGGSKGLSYQALTNGSASVIGTIEYVGGKYIVSVGGQSNSFTQSGGSYISDQGDGATLTISGGQYKYTAHDGMVATFASNSGYVYSFYEGEIARLARIDYTDGSRQTFTFRVSVICPGYEGNTCVAGRYYVARLSSVTNSNG